MQSWHVLPYGGNGLVGTKQKHYTNGLEKGIWVIKLLRAGYAAPGSQTKEEKRRGERKVTVCLFRLSYNTSGVDLILDAYYTISIRLVDTRESVIKGGMDAFYSFHPIWHTKLA